MESTGLDMLSAAARRQTKSKAENSLTSKEQARKVVDKQHSTASINSAPTKSSKRPYADKICEVIPMAYEPKVGSNLKYSVPPPNSMLSTIFTYPAAAFPALSPYNANPSFIEGKRMKTNPSLTSMWHSYNPNPSASLSAAYHNVAHPQHRQAIDPSLWKAGHSPYVMNNYAGPLDVANAYHPSYPTSTQPRRRHSSGPDAGKYASNADMLPEFNLRTLKNDMQTKLELVILLLNERKMRKSVPA
jgi:hypothetical protein